MPAGNLSQIHDYSNINTPVRVMLDPRNIYSGAFRTELSTPANSPVHSGDLLTYTIDPSSVARFDLSDFRLQPGYTNTTYDCNIGSISNFNAGISSGRELKYQLIEASDSKIVYKILEIGQGESNYLFDHPFVVTDLSGWIQ